ncbi:threonine dehydratase [Actibacterium sp. 188UL27-1]|uniref:threonine dehydratase n=1 Tax=Actibacterium sp. 188UL27-1 TaxID=2786961 RepID=UPI00195C7A15|nr:threonine dehydratase [Actibacterium sp. 188UL27-1]MBM7068199.1 threonine dehydratase [Actibacterium sp. 188UL27-1]
MMFSKDALQTATAFVHTRMTPTPQYAWPTLQARTGAQVWVKHENHTPTGAFKVRGALTFMDWLVRTQPKTPGIVTATRGNHGQGQAMAATANGLRALVYVPLGNSVEKNAAMRAFGAELIEFGDDFDAAREEAFRVAAAEGLTIVPPFHPELVRGVATYGFELLTAVPDLDTIYVPIGCGSGICGVIAARDALGLATNVVGVVADGAQTAMLSAQSGRLIETETAYTFADGMAVRVPVAEAFEIYAKGAERFVSVSDDAIAEAVRIYYTDTHNLAEGAGAAPLAALMQDKDRMAGRKVGVILCGGNIDTGWMQTILAGDTPVI